MAYRDDMCSTASIYIGDSPITLVATETGAAPEALNAVYDQVYASILASYPWSFAYTYTELSEPTAWALTTIYAADTYVSNGGENYRCKLAHTASAPSAWINSVDYAEDEYVTGADSIVYIYILANGVSTPVVEPAVTSGWETYWTAEAFTSVYEPGDGSLTATYWAESLLSGFSNNYPNYSNEFVLPSSNIIRTWEMLPTGIDFKPERLFAPRI